MWSLYRGGQLKGVRVIIKPIGRLILRPAKCGHFRGVVNLKGLSLRGVTLYIQQRGVLSP